MKAIDAKMGRLCFVDGTHFVYVVFIILVDKNQYISFIINNFFKIKIYCYTDILIFINKLSLRLIEKKAYLIK